jgi:uncharacterized membrane protein YhaH (DUF805 family)
MDEQDWAELERAVAPRHPAPPADTGLSLWLSPAGRISRSTYWLKFIVPMWGIQMVALAADVGLGLTGPELMGAIYVITSLVLIWPGFVAMVKRLHDLGHSGWLIPGIYGSGMLAALVSTFAFAAGGIAALLAGLALVGFGFAALWISIKIAFLRGTVGPNAYGPDPLRWKV